MPRSSVSTKDPKQGRAQVRACLASLPPDSRRIVNKMREAILAAAPSALATEIKAYDVAKGMIRFPLAKPPSGAFVRRLVKARIAEVKKNLKPGKAR